MPVARNEWQPSSVAMPAAAARRQIIRSAIGARHPPLGECAGFAGRGREEGSEHPLAGEVDLAHRRLQPPGPGPVQITEPGIAEPVGGAGAVLLPQQRQRHVGTAQLAVHPAPIGYRPLIGRGPGRRRKQERFEPRVVEILGQWPGDTGRARPAQIPRHRAVKRHAIGTPIGVQKGPPHRPWDRLVPVANRRDPRASRSALTSDGAARVGSACLPTGASRGGTAVQARFLKRQLALPVSTISQ